MIKWALRARIIITCTYLMIVITYTIILGMLVLGKSIRLISNSTDSGSVSLIIPTYYIYDVTKEPQYKLTIIGQYISLIIVVMLYTGIDNFLGLLVFHICGQLDILSKRLKYSHENFRTILRRNVICHIRLLRYIAVLHINII
jgi:hypothetical protein